MPVRNHAVTLADAQQRYREVVHHGRSGKDVRPFVAASWQRSMSYEVDSTELNAPYFDNPNTDIPLVRAALPILTRLVEQLAGDPISTMITDRDGMVLSRMVSHEGLTSRLNRVHLAPGHMYSERHVGTNGIGTALESGSPVMIIGSEHYAEALRLFQCAAVPILHPTRRTLLGAFNLTTTGQDSAGMLMALARSTADAIENEIAAISSRRERALFHDYMESCASVRPGPVLALNRDIMMMNEQLRAAVTGADQHALVEFAQETADDTRFEGTRSFALPSGRVAELKVRRSRRDGNDAGAIFRVRVIGRPQPRPAGGPGAPVATGLVGSSRQWLRVVADVQTAVGSGSWLCVVGEAGVGKRALVEAAHRSAAPQRRLVTLDPPTSGSDTAALQWLGEVGSRLAEPGTVLQLRDSHLLGDRVRRQLVTLLDGLDRDVSGQLVVLRQPGAEVADELDRLLDATVEVPPIRHRADDVEQLLRHFLRRYRPNGDSACTPAAMTMLKQCPWPENVRQLESVLQGLLRRNSGRTIDVDDLPPECRVSSRNVLTPIEALERDAILRGLVDHQSNVQSTARALGISRATMYRKMRRYGIVPANLV